MGEKLIKIKTGLCIFNKINQLTIGKVFATILIGVQKMATLTRKEIVTQLKRLGINTLTELESFLREYKEYCNDFNSHL
jgi:hypothetical protein